MESIISFLAGILTAVFVFFVWQLDERSFDPEHSKKFQPGTHKFQIYREVGVPPKVIKFQGGNEHWHYWKCPIFSIGASMPLYKFSFDGDGKLIEIEKDHFDC